MSETTTAAAPAAAPAAPAIGTPEYDAAMAAKYRASKEAPEGGADEIALASAPTQTGRPEGVPEKFWDAATGQVNVEALLKSYSELERTRGQPSKPVSPAATPGDMIAPAPDAPKPDEAGARAAATEAGLDYDALAAKFAKTGTIEDADYAALEAAGVPKAVVEDYAKLLQGRVAAEAQAATAYIGGDEAKTQMLTWAASNLTEAEKVQYNEALRGPAWKMAVDSLKSRMAQASPTHGEPQLETGGNAAGSPAGYRSKAEMKADMMRPEYQRDPQFRVAVAQKMRFASWDLDR